MRTLVLLLAALGASASAQTGLVSEASVDQPAYAYGEPITFRYTVRNEGSTPTSVWGSSSCVAGLTFGSLVAPGEGGTCTTDERPFAISPGGSLVWVWVLDPAALGVPEADGPQTIVGYITGSCGPTWGTQVGCRLEATATLDAPRYLGGAVWLLYAPADVDSVAALKAAYGAVVTDSTAYRFGIAERWLIEGVSLANAVAALDENDVIEYAEMDRAIGPSALVEVADEPGPETASLSPPAPNPFADATAFTVRLARPETVTVDLIDGLGRTVAVLHDGPLPTGVDHRFVVAGDGLPAGLYVVRVRGETVRASRRVVLAR